VGDVVAMSVDVRAVALLRRVALVNPWRLHDDGSNKVCFACMSYRDHDQRDGSGRGPGTHAEGCVVADVRSFLDEVAR